MATVLCYCPYGKKNVQCEERCEDKLSLITGIIASQYPSHAVLILENKTILFLSIKKQLLILKQPNKKTSIKHLSLPNILFQELT